MPAYYCRVLQRVICAATLAALLLCCAQRARAASKSGELDWRGFRGADGRGAVMAAKLFASRTGFSLKTSWKRPLGSGYSGVAVAGEYVVTAFSDGESDVLAAFDAATGAEQWRYTIGKTYEGHDGSHTGPISTPLIAGERVVFLSPFGHFGAVNLRSGSELWTTHLTTNHAASKPHYGFATSPILVDGVIVLQLGGANGAVAGFDPATGKRLWGAGEDAVQYQSPILWKLAGREQVVAACDKKLFGIDPAEGTVIWEHAHGGSSMGLGVASASPLPIADNRLFLTHTPETCGAFEVSFQDGAGTVKQVWDNDSIRKSYNCSVYHDGHVYGYNARTLTCVKADTGERVWRSREPGDGFTILVDGHLVIQTKLGGVHVAEATPSGYREAAGLSVFDEDVSWTPPSFALGSIFVRNMKELARIDVVSGLPSEPVVEEKQRLPADSRFGRFLAKVAGAVDKKAVVDEFMASVDRTPLVDDRDMVHFIFRGPAEDMAVAGDVFGARQERVMTRVPGTDLFYFSAPIESDARANYVLVKDYEQILDPLNPRKTATSVYTKEMEMSFGRGGPMEMSWFGMPDWKEPTHVGDASPAKRGRIEKKELESKILAGKVNLQVYVPSGYDESKQRYPVAYVFNGSDALETGKMATAMDNLAGTRVAPLLAVFIDVEGRVAAPKHAQMVAEELVPFIDGNYRTKNSADARASIGMGFPGFNALVCAFAHHDVLGKVGCQSTFMFGSMKGQLEPLMTTASEKSLTMYLDWGKYDLRNSREAWDLAQTNRELAQTLREKGYAPVGGEANDGTGWSSWQNRTDDLLAALFPAK